MRMPRLTSQPASAASSVFGRTPTATTRISKSIVPPLLEERLVRLELRHRVAEQEFYALALDVLLDDGRRDLGQNVRQDARREVDDGQLGNTLVDALGALQADEARADDEHALVVRLAEHFVQMLRVVERHEARFVLDRVQTLHRGNEPGASRCRCTVCHRGRTRRSRARRFCFSGQCAAPSCRAWW